MTLHHFAVALVDGGLALLLVAAVALLRPLARLGLPTRRRALALGAAGALLGALGALLPAPDRRAPATASRLDAVVPVWQFAERHAIEIRAAPAAVERALREVSAREIFLFRLLTWLRSPRLPRGETPESILAPSPDEPILDVALRTGFQLLAEEPGREIVFGTLVVVPDEIRRLPPERLARLRSELTAERFAALSDPGYAKAVMNFRWREAGRGRTRLTTETRVVATDAAARRRFAVYWRIIYPGSSYLRHAWLAAVRARAERTS